MKTIEDFRFEKRYNSQSAAVNDIILFGLEAIQNLENTKKIIAPNDK